MQTRLSTLKSDALHWNFCHMCTPRGDLVHGFVLHKYSADHEWKVPSINCNFILLKELQSRRNVITDAWQNLTWKFASLHYIFPNIYQYFKSHNKLLDNHILLIDYFHIKTTFPTYTTFTARTENHFLCWACEDK